MKPENSSPPDVNEEIAALIETLHQAEQRLEELTAGEVDTVSNLAGRTLMLQRAQEQLRLSEAAKQTAILNALPAQIALLDTQGRIISVNETWRRFAGANALLSPEYGVGLNYLEVCDSAQGDHAAEAHQAAAGIRSVLAGTVKSFSLEYPCHSPTEQRWFQMTVSPLADQHPNGAVVMHMNITERKRVEESLQLRELEQRQLAQLLEAERSRLVAAQRIAKVGSWETDLATLAVIWSEQTHRIFETDPEKFKPTHQIFLELVHPDDRATVDDAFFKSLQQPSTCNIEHRILMPDGRIKFVEESWQAHFNDQEHPVQAVGTIQDITDRKAAEAKIIYLNRVYAVLSGINTVIVRIRDRQELFDEACHIAVEQGQFELAWIGLLDPKAQEITQVAWATRSGSEMDDPRLFSAKLSVRSDTSQGQGETARAIREKRPVYCNDIASKPEIGGGVHRAVAIRMGLQSIIALPIQIGGKVLGNMTLFAEEANFFDAAEIELLTELAGDISFALDHIEKEERLNYLAYYDALTGLANRTLFLERVAQYMRSAVSGGHKLALCLIDLERFTNINDSLGRPAGDVLLKQVAEWLIRNAGDANLLARIDTDHFAIVLPEVMQGGDVARQIEKTLAAFQDHPFRLNDAVFRVAAKVGIALFPDDGADADTLLKNAEAALKNAKRSGDRYLFHTQKMTEAVAVKLSLENQLRQALDNEEFVLHYQPKVNLESGKVTSAEALIRWNNPRTGLVPPGKFIPILEETGVDL